MILNDKELMNHCIMNNLVSPLSEGSIQPASVDLRLGDSFLKPVNNYRGYNNFNDPVEYSTINGSYMLKPHEFVLGTTKEVIDLPNNLTAFVEGRSSIGRMGLFVQNAGWVDPGFKGEITLELYNASDVPIKLVPGRRVAQLVFCKMSGSCETPYNGKYQNQSGATASKINEDKEY